MLELQDKFGDVTVEPPASRAAGTDEAVRALVGLGYGLAPRMKRCAPRLADGAPQDASQLIRRALQQLAAARGGR